MMEYFLHLPSSLFLKKLVENYTGEVTYLAARYEHDSIPTLHRGGANLARLLLRADVRKKHRVSWGVRGDSMIHIGPV